MWLCGNRRKYRLSQGLWKAESPQSVRLRAVPQGSSRFTLPLRIGGFLNREAVAQLSPGLRVCERTLGKRSIEILGYPEGVAQIHTVEVKPFQGLVGQGPPKPRVRSRTRDPGLSCQTPSALRIRQTPFGAQIGDASPLFGNGPVSDCDNTIPS